MDSSGALDEAVSQYASGNLTRRDFLKRAAALGIGAASASVLLAAQSSSAAQRVTSSGTSSKPVKGGTFREGYDRDFTPPNPVANTWADPDYKALFEALIMRDPEGKMVPMMADSFTSGPTAGPSTSRTGSSSSPEHQ